MKKENVIPLLSALLLLQLLLAAGIHWAGSHEENSAAIAKLMTADMGQIDTVQIEDGENKVILKKVNQQWRLPEIDFLADGDKLKTLVDKLSSFQKGWPVATTAEAAKRFKVSDKEFERKISLGQGDAVNVALYLGTSPSYRNVHARLDGESDILSIALSSYDVGVKIDDWINKDILKQPLADLQRVSIDKLVLEKINGVWSLVGLADTEQVKASEIQNLLSKLSSIRIDAVLGKENKEEYALDVSAHHFVFERTDGSKVSYQLAKPQDKSFFVLKSSGFEQYFQVPAYTVNSVLEAKRDSLIEPKTSVSPSAPVADANGDADSEH